MVAPLVQWDILEFLRAHITFDTYVVNSNFGELELFAHNALEGHRMWRFIHEQKDKNVKGKRRRRQSNPSPRDITTQKGKLTERRVKIQQ